MKDHDLRALGRSRTEIFLKDITWSFRYNIHKNDQYSNLSTDWTLVSLSFIVQNYGFILIYDVIDSVHFYMFFPLL